MVSDGFRDDGGFFLPNIEEKRHIGERKWRDGS
jgi:hypothetical protein